MPGWAEATTYAELLALARRFLAGELDRFPGWGAGDLDEESDALRPALLHATAAGILPVASQPGEPFAPGHDGHAWGRRAFVGGFVDPQRCDAVVGAITDRGLVALVQGPRVPPTARSVPVGLRDGTPFLVLGPDARAHELEIFGEAVGPGAAAALEACPFMWLVDPQWGRRAALPRALESLPR